MSKKARAARRPAVGRGLPSAFLIFGEDQHDRRTIRHFVEGLRPDLAGSLHEFREPLVLVKNVTPSQLIDRVQRLKVQVAASAVRLSVREVMVHEDCDNVEPAHLALEEKYRKAFLGAPFEVHPVLPAWEIETWLMQWPSVMRAYRPSWREPTEFRGRKLGLIRNAKEHLMKALVPRDLKKGEKARFRSYEEIDSPGIAAKVCERGLLTKPEGMSDSFARFVAKVRGFTITPPPAGC